MALRTGDIIMGIYKKVPGWKDLSENELKQLKAVLASISEDFVNFCESNEINYMMGAGTALGAVRHHGFIPWDDDIDFHVPRKDYNKILELAPKYLGDKYYIFAPSKDNVSFPSIHLVLKGSSYKNFADVFSTDSLNEEEMGIYIDIIPYDNMSEIKLFRDAKELFMLGLHFIFSCVKIHSDCEAFKKNGIVISSDDYSKLRLKDIIGKMCGFWSIQKWTRFMDRIAASNNNDKSKWVCCFVGRKFHKYTHLRADLWGENRETFEGRRWKIATNVDWYLTKEYSKDYMTPPPAGKRKIHPVFKLEFPK